jgi:hypothetical protein
MAEKKKSPVELAADQSASDEVKAANKEAEERRKKMMQMQAPAPPAAAGPGLWDALMNFAIKLRKKQLPQAAGER